ncbi:MAG TPA: hypothetical protein VE990_11690 [Acidimicrobiales bacterium]|nr:hypothetical protein [Acidimicrobiales bacterium]
MAAARLGLGVAMLVAPRRLGRLWLGPGVDDPRTRLVLRSMAARDAIVGAGALVAWRRRAPLRGWIEAGAAADAADLVATLVAARSLPPTGRYGVSAFAAAGAVGGAALARRA